MPAKNPDKLEKTSEFILKDANTVSKGRIGLSETSRDARMLMMLGILTFGSVLLIGQDLLLPEGIIEFVSPVLAPPETMREVSSHPYQQYSEIWAEPKEEELLVPASLGPESQDKIWWQFHQLLSTYERRQARDDNFTIRVLNQRHNRLLEVYTLDDMRAAWLESPTSIDWGMVDERRRIITSKLVEKHVRRGVNRDDITVKWGRSTQILQARYRDEPYVEHEIRLAQWLGLSLLVTEIGTIETFNRDDLMSSVGALGRYQMMPYMLRQFDLRHYKLPLRAGGEIEVEDERNPLLTLLPSFTLVKAYTNTVGHELAGISAYHTGPANIFGLFEVYMKEHRIGQTWREKTVLDAYMWAVTEGFPKVSAGSSFKDYSRAYVPSAYGALRAVDNLPLDFSRTIKAERVQLAAGQQIYLSDLLNGLEAYFNELSWGPENGYANLYDRFRILNKHILLPETERNLLNVPPAGDILLSDVSGKANVRFFLPIGASKLLEKDGVALFNSQETFAYDDSAFLDPKKTGEYTEWDKEYDELVARTMNFGFTFRQRNHLQTLASEFSQMAEENPTPYRLAQAKISNIHLSMWQTRLFRRLANKTSNQNFATTEVTTEAILLPSIQTPSAVSTDTPSQDKEE